MDETEGAQAEKLTRKKHTRRAHTAALENADSIAQIIKCGQEIPFILPVAFAEQGKATNTCMETHKARLEIYNSLPEEQKPFYEWTLRKVEMEGAWWIEVGPVSGRQRRVSASAKAFNQALQAEVAKRKKMQNPDGSASPAAAPTTDDVLKKHGYY